MKEKVLLTGAFGNIGKSTIKELIKQGYFVRCFDLKTKANEKVVQKYKGKIETAWGDIRNTKDVAAAVNGQDVVIHLAFVIPPVSEIHPEIARDINVGGTKNLLNAMKVTSNPPKIIFASSIAVFGNTQNRLPPRIVSDSLKPIEHYARHKVECEKLIQESGLTFTILRFAAVQKLKIDIMDSLQFEAMFKVPLNTRIEFLHTRDAGLAVTNAIGNKKVWGKILLIGGGKNCQLFYRDYIEKILDALGIGKFPDEAFGLEPFHTDWMDSTEGQKLLSYQRYSFNDYIREVVSLLGWRKYFIRLFRPLIRRWILNKSLYWKIKKK